MGKELDFLSRPGVFEPLDRTPKDHSKPPAKPSKPPSNAAKETSQSLQKYFPAEVARVLEPVEAPLDAPFQVEVSDFKFVQRGIRNGKALRFTVTWMFTHGKYGVLGQSEEGWLMTRSGEGKLRVSPPITKFGPMQSKQFKTITEGFHGLVLGMICNSKTKSGKSYADYVGEEDPLRALRPEEVDAELPLEVRG